MSDSRNLLFGDFLCLFGTTSSLLSQLWLGHQAFVKRSTDMISGQFAHNQFGSWTSDRAFPQQTLSQFTGMLDTLTVLTSDGKQETILDDLLALQVTLLFWSLIITTRFAQVKQESTILLLDEQRRNKEIKGLVNKFRQNSINF